MRAWIAVALMCGVHVARADDSLPIPPEPTEEPPAPAPPPPPPAPDPRWRFYDAAFEKLGAGDEAGAHALLEKALVGDPSHPVTALATARLADLDARHPKPEGNGVARGEFVFWTTAGSVLVAAEACVAIDCHGDREYAGVYTLTVGSALAGSLLLSTHMREGQAQLYNSTQTWAAWNALGIDDGFPSDGGEAAVGIVSQGVGLGLGVGLWHTWHPTSGAVALTNSAFLWSTVLAIEGYEANASSASLRAAVVAGDIGILAGALASTQVDMSRGRTLVIDLGGVLGTLAGGLVATGTSGGDRAVGTSLLIGTAVGLVAATYATAHWDAPKNPPVAIVPMRVGDAWGAAVSFTR